MVDPAAVSPDQGGASLPRPIRIGLLWHSDRSGNLGVGALTIGNMAIVREVASEMGLDPQFEIIGMRDSGPVYLKPGEASVYILDSRRMVSPGGYWRELKGLDCVLDIGAGDSFADIYGLKRFAFMWLSKVLAVVSRTPLLLSPQTIGPFTKPLFKTLARIALSGAECVVARDPMSFALLETLAPSGRRALSADVAFALPYEDRSSLRGGRRTRVGVNVSGLLFNQAEDGDNRFGLSVNYAAMTRLLLARLAARPDTEVQLIAHVSESGAGHRDDDGAVLDRLAAEFPAVVRAATFAGPSEAKAYISGLDFLVAGRMHACIAAYSSGVAVVPVAYSRKFIGLFGMLDYPWMVPEKGLDTEQAVQYILECLERRDQLSRDIALGLTKAKRLLDVYRAELRRLFSRALNAS